MKRLLTSIVLLGILATYSAEAIEPSSWADRTLPRRVLMIGDSHSEGAFGERLFELVSGAWQTESVDGYASCGSTPQAWSTQWVTHCRYAERSTTTRDPVRARRHPTPRLRDLLAVHQPDLTIVQMGGNLMKVRSDREVRAQVEAMASRIVNSGSRCIWVGVSPSREFDQPIRGRSRRELARLVQIAAEPFCVFIDSTELIQYPETGGDRPGIHYPRGPARLWAERVFERISEIFQGAR